MRRVAAVRNDGEYQGHGRPVAFDLRNVRKSIIISRVLSTSNTVCESYHQDAVTCEVFGRKRIARGAAVRDNGLETVTQLFVLYSFFETYFWSNFVV